MEIKDLIEKESLYVRNAMLNLWPIITILLDAELSAYLVLVVISVPNKKEMLFMNEWFVEQPIKTTISVKNHSIFNECSMTLNKNQEVLPLLSYEHV